MPHEIRVRLNGHLRALAGKSEIALHVRSDATVFDVLQQLQNETPALCHILLDDLGRLNGEALIALGDRIIAQDELDLRVSDEVVELIPQLSGGAAFCFVQR